MLIDWTSREEQAPRMIGRASQRRSVRLAVRECRGGMTLLLPLLALLLSPSALLSLHHGTAAMKRRVASINMRLDPSFLQSPSQETYINQILRCSVDSCKKAIKASKRLVEIDFIANRKNDLSVAETLDITRAFTGEFIKPFVATYGNDLWLLFPERSEQQLALKAWGLSGDRAPITVTCIKDALGYLKKDGAAASTPMPRLMIAVSPGFNIDEYINLAEIGSKMAPDCPLLIINGQLDRIRNGYYPSLFYPGLAKTVPFYSSFSYIFWLANLSFDGNRFAGWISKTFDTEFEVFVRDKNNNGAYELVLELPAAEKLNYNKAYNLAKEWYKRRNGGF